MSESLNCIGNYLTKNYFYPGNVINKTLIKQEHVSSSVGVVLLIANKPKFPKGQERIKAPNVDLFSYSLQIAWLPPLWIEYNGGSQLDLEGMVKEGLGLMIVFLRSQSVSVSYYYVASSASWKTKSLLERSR